MLYITRKKVVELFYHKQTTKGVCMFA